MAETAVKTTTTDAEDVGVLRVYEVGYHIVPSVKEEELEKVVASIRSLIEGSGGTFIAEGAPALVKLSYPMSIREGEKHLEYDRGYFGWIKFESRPDAALSLEEALAANRSLLRRIVFETVREDTRAKMRAPQLREVKRTDTIKAAPRRVEEAAAPVSEEDLEKAIQDITAE